MRRLSTELQLYIFGLLDQYDQLECMLTCRSWNNIIEEFCLFQTLTIYSFEYMKKISNRIEHQPDIVNNVNQLTIHFCDILDFDLTNFLSLFPRIQRFYCHSNCFANLYTSDTAKVSWQKHIQKMVEISSHPIGLHLLRKEECPNLTELNVFEFDEGLIDSLKNAPGLRSLTLSNGSFKINDIDKIHKYLPHLQDLQLRDKDIKSIESTEFDMDTIVPATSITKVVWTYIDAYYLNTQLKLLQYITKKYPSLMELTLETTFSPKTNGDINTLHIHGWQPLLQNLGSQLKKLHINFSNQIPNFLNALDVHHCQIYDLKIHYYPQLDTFPKPELSQQVSHIRKLVISDIRWSNLIWLKEFKLLEFLKIVSVRSDIPCRINFNDIIENTPHTLQSLILERVNFKPGPMSSRKSNIKKLAFIEIRLPKQTPSFIDRHLPLLTNLTIKNCKHQIKEFNLRSIRFNLFCYFEEYRKEPIDIRVHTMHDEHCYSTKTQKYQHGSSYFHIDRDDEDYPPVRSQPVISTSPTPDFVLYCYAVKKIILCR